MALVVPPLDRRPPQDALPDDETVDLPTHKERMAMRAALSIVLAGLLVTTPLKQVLAQADQQEAVSVQRTASPDSSGHRLIRVPPVTDNTARLWQHRVSPSPADPLFTDERVRLPQQFWPGTPTAVKIAVIIVVLVAVIALAEFDPAW